MKALPHYIKFLLALPALGLWLLSVWLMKLIYPEFLGSVLREALEEYQRTQTK